MALRHLGGKVALASMLLVAALLPGCATRPADPEDRKDYDAINDPIEPTNRFFFGFNQTVDHGFVRPIALAYRAAVPDPARQSVHNVVVNLRAPWVFINDALQGDADRAGVTFGRFFINSTIGVLGLFDVAGSLFKLPFRDNDAGITLAKWGAPEGPYLVLPILGPSNPRDATGTGLAFFFDPIDLYLAHHDLVWATWVQTGVEAIDTRTIYLDPLDSLERTSLDLYSALRSITRQHRNDQINGKAPTSNVFAPKESKLPKQDGPQAAAQAAQH
jgi:phospholipid-binding lipoprotein MlaA